MLYFNCPLLADKEMKVKSKDSIRYRVLKRIRSLSSTVITRADVAKIAQPRQISRALKSLTEEGYLTKLGYGVYAKLTYSAIGKTTYLKEGPLVVMRLALNKLKVKWETSIEEQDYNAGRSTQIPVNPTTKLKTRFRRKLQYKNMEFRIEQKFNTRRAFRVSSARNRKIKT